MNLAKTYLITGASRMVVERCHNRIPSDILSVLEYAFLGSEFLRKGSSIRITTDISGPTVANRSVGASIVPYSGAWHDCWFGGPGKTDNRRFDVKLIEQCGDCSTSIIIPTSDARTRDEALIFFTRVIIGESMFSCKCDSATRLVTPLDVVPVEGVVKQLLWDNEELMDISDECYYSSLVGHIHKCFFRWYATRVPDMVSYCSEHNMNELTMDILRTCEEEGINCGSNQTFRL